MTGLQKIAYFLALSSVSAFSAFQLLGGAHPWGSAPLFVIAAVLLGRGFWEAFKLRKSAG
jgi:hypothetical protein